MTKQPEPDWKLRALWAEEQLRRVKANLFARGCDAALWDKLTKQTWSGAFSYEIEPLKKGETQR